MVKAIALNSKPLDMNPVFRSPTYLEYFNHNPDLRKNSAIKKLSITLSHGSCGETRFLFRLSPMLILALATQSNRICRFDFLRILNKLIEIGLNIGKI